MWRARCSVPALLARHDERRVVSAVTALNGGLAILVVSLFAWLTELPLVFPALGPSIFILFSAPLSAAAAPRSVILGHWVSIAAGYVVWWAVSYVAGHPVSLEAGGWPLIMSASMALALMCFLLVRLSCPHPPACGSGLVVALGAVTAPLDLLLMALVIVWLCVQAVALNRAVGVPVPTWSPRARETL
jgi:CBS-domain-containing membrane protein